MAKLLLLICSAGVLLLLATTSSAARYQPRHRDSRSRDLCEDGRMKDKPQCSKSREVQPIKMKKFPKQWDSRARRLLSPYGQHNRVLVSLPYPGEERTPSKREEKREKPTESPCKYKETENKKTECEKELEKSREKKPCSKIPKIKSALRVIDGMRELLSME